MGKKKWSYAILRSMFGDLWVGKTQLTPNEKSIFSNFDDAIERAKQLNDSIENADELDAVTEEDTEEISKGVEKWIIS